MSPPQKKKFLCSHASCSMDSTSQFFYRASSRKHFLPGLSLTVRQNAQLHVDTTHIHGHEFRTHAQFHIVCVPFWLTFLINPKFLLLLLFIIVIYHCYLLLLFIIVIYHCYLLLLFIIVIYYCYLSLLYFLICY